MIICISVKNKGVDGLNKCQTKNHCDSPTGIFPLATCLDFPYLLTSTAFSVAHIWIWVCEERYGPILPWAL